MTDFIFQNWGNLDSTIPTTLFEWINGLLHGSGNPMDWLFVSDDPYGSLGEVIRDYVQPAPLINDHMIRLNNYLMEFGLKHCSNLTELARNLAAIFAIIVMAGQAYKMMAKGEGLDILKLGRPLLIALVLFNWTGFVSLVATPGMKIEQHFQGVYAATKDSVQAMRTKRNQLSWNIGDEIERKKASGEVVKKNLWEKTVDALGDLWDDVKEIGTQVATVTTTWIMKQVEDIIYWIGELFFQIAVYFVFLVKALMFTVAVMFGPVYIAFSILPAWEGAWHQWIERTVQISLYGAMAYLCMAFSQQLIMFALEVDVSKLDGIIDTGGSAGAVWAYVKSGFGTMIQTAVAYFVGGASLFMSFEMASFAIPGSMVHGSSQFFKGMGNKMKLPV